MPQASLKLVTGPETEPITRAQVKLFLRMEDESTEEDSFIDSLILTARQIIEEYLGRALITQVWDAHFDNFYVASNTRNWWDGVKELPISELNRYEGGFLKIPRPVLQGATLYTVGSDNEETEFDSAFYYLDTASEPGRLILDDGEIWPADLRNYHSVRARFTAGYGDSADDVPAPIKQAMKIFVGHLYETRGCGDVEMPSTVKKLLNPYRVYWL